MMVRKYCFSFSTLFSLSAISIQQLESLGSTVSGSGLFSGTVSIDKTVGNNTAFLILYEHSLAVAPPPTILVESPSGQKYNTYKPDPKGNSLTLDIPGTAEVCV